MARASIWALRDHGDEPITRIDAHVAGDVECFATPKEFLDEITIDALRHFTHIVIDNRNETAHLRITFLRRKPKSKAAARDGAEQDPGLAWLDAGVLLEVEPLPESTDAQLRSVRERAAAAIERGRAKGSQVLRGGASDDGDLNRASPQSAVAQLDEGRKKPRSSSTTSWVSAAVVGVTTVTLMARLTNLGSWFRWPQLLIFGALYGALFRYVNLRTLVEADRFVAVTGPQQAWQKWMRSLGGKIATLVIGVLVPAATVWALSKAGLKIPTR